MYEIDQTYLAYELAYRAERMRRRASRPAPRGTPHPARRTPPATRRGAEPSCRLMSAAAAMMDVVATHTSTLVGRDRELDEVLAWVRSRRRDRACCWPVTPASARPGW